MGRVFSITLAFFALGCSSATEAEAAADDAAVESALDTQTKCLTYAADCPVECASETATAYVPAQKCVSKSRVVACMPRPTKCSPIVTCLARDGIPYGFALDCQLQIRDSQWRSCTAEESALLDSAPCP